MPNITKVFTTKNEKETIANAYQKLIDIYKGNKHKAAGSLGGASRSGFIVLNNGTWERTR